MKKISGYTVEQARALFCRRWKPKQEAKRRFCTRKLKARQRKRRTKARRKSSPEQSRDIAADHVAESTVSVVPLPNDEMKGRIIGREGRNIRAIESATGIDLIIDDTPEAVILSGFDPVRRKLPDLPWKNSLLTEEFIRQESRKMAEKSEREVNAIIKEEANEQPLIGIHNLHPELIKLLGRLKFRTSYGQNVLKHSIEVAHLAGLYGR